MKIFSDLPTVYLHRDAVDFRRSINGLVCIVEMQMKISPFDDALFMFCKKNKSRYFPRTDAVKLLYNEDKLGLSPALVRIGGSLFIDSNTFNDWLDQNRDEPT